MNSEPSSSANGPSSVWRALPAQTAGILAASILLGLAYNSASPLRVREMRPDEISAPQAVTNSVTQPATVRTGYFSEPRSLTSQVPATAAPKPTPTQVSPAVAPSAAGAPLVIPEVKWPEVKALVDDGKIVLVDARLQANYDLGHIPGAVLLPATSLAPELQAFAFERFYTPTTSRSVGMAAD